MAPRRCRCSTSSRSRSRAPMPSPTRWRRASRARTSSPSAPGTACTRCSAISTIAPPRSMAARTRSSAASSRGSCCGCDETGHATLPLPAVAPVGRIAVVVPAVAIDVARAPIGLADLLADAAQLARIVAERGIVDALVALVISLLDARLDAVELLLDRPGATRIDAVLAHAIGDRVVEMLLPAREPGIAFVGIADLHGIGRSGGRRQPYGRRQRRECGFDHDVPQCCVPSDRSSVAGTR